MELLNKYFEIQKQIYKYFGYEENWTVYPIDDCTKYYWKIHDSTVYFADTIEDFVDGCRYYDCEIIANTIYQKSDYTMILVNTHTDGNCFLSIYDNSKKFYGTIDDVE